MTETIVRTPRAADPPDHAPRLVAPRSLTDLAAPTDDALAERRRLAHAVRQPPLRLSPERAPVSVLQEVRAV